MSLLSRLSAAYSAFTKGKVPQGRSIPLPFFYGNGYNNALNVRNQPTINRINAKQLRAFSESPIPRRAIDYIRNQVTRLNWDLTPVDGKKLKREDKKRVEILKNVLMQPNPDDNFQSWLGQLIEDMLVIGMGTSEIRAWTNLEHPYLLYPIDASSIQIYIDWDGDPRKPRYAQSDLRGQVVNFKPSEILVMKHNNRTNTPFGLSPVEVSIQQIQYFLDAQAYAGKTASTAVPKKLLFLGGDADGDQVKEFQYYFRNEIEGRSHIPIIGGISDAKSVELGHSGDQALFLQWQAFLIGVIADAFGLDIMKFNDIAGVNRSTGDTLDDVSDEGAIRPMASTIEHYINQNLVSLFGLNGVVEFKFKFTTSFQDRKALAVIHQIYAQIDTLTINEIREEAGYPPLPVDEETGQSKGDMTISEYRAKYGQPPPVMPEEDPQDDSTGNPAADPNNNGGNNGVNGAPVPKPKPMNQRTDKADATL